MFGTFQEELDDVPPQYGVLKPANTWNPIIINFQHIWRLMQDAWRTRSYWDKLRIWFMPTGWRPKDVKDKYPVEVIQDVYNFKKYRPETSPWLKGYALFQLIATTFLMLFMFYSYSEIGFDGLLLFGTFIFVGIYGYTTLMDRKSYAVWIEVIRGVAGLVLIYLSGDWFGIDAYVSIGSYLVALYFLITIFGGVYFTYVEKSFATADLAS
jgi:drug/metabolite transporter (DMT)-like permease